MLAEANLIKLQLYRLGLQSPHRGDQSQPTGHRLVHHAKRSILHTHYQVHFRGQERAGGQGRAREGRPQFFPTENSGAASRYSFSGQAYTRASGYPVGTENGHVPPGSVSGLGGGQSLHFCHSL